ncbi:MAG: serine/threonine-protein phosphatase, partial [Candidatus Rokuibacteriota bacterium]
MTIPRLRNTRRQGASLLEQAAAANTALSEYAPSVADDAYATGLLGRLELRSGALTLVNAGHDAPYLARG